MQAHEGDIWPSVATPQHELGVKSVLKGVLLDRHSDKHMPPCVVFFSKTLIFI